MSILKSNETNASTTSFEAENKTDDLNVDESSTLVSIANAKHVTIIQDIETDIVEPTSPIREEIMEEVSTQYGNVPLKRMSIASQLQAMCSDENIDVYDLPHILNRDSLNSVISQNDIANEYDLEKRQEFFHFLQEIPSISDLLADDSKQSEALKEIEEHEEQEAAEEVNEDEKFVDPMAMTETSDEKSTKDDVDESMRTTEEPITTGTTKPDSVISLISVYSEDDELLELLPKETEKIKHVTIVEEISDEQLLALCDIQQKGVKEPHQVDDRAAEAAAAEQSYTIAQEFLDGLIMKIISAMESQEPFTMLHTKCDKKKLFNEFCLKLRELAAEKTQKTFLNTKTVEHFKRKKVLRALQTADAKPNVKDIERLQNAMKQLDAVLQKENDIETISTETIVKLEEECQSIDNENSDIISDFKSVIKKTLFREGFDHLNMAIENNLKRMDSHRKEVSKERREIINKQHTLASLKERLKHLDDLGNGLRIMDFEFLQNKVNNLEKRLQDRNDELAKKHLFCDNDIHVMSHLREQKQMLLKSIEQKQHGIKIALKQGEKQRKCLYELGLAHSANSRNLMNLRNNDTLVDKPVLMHDYDDTVNKLKKLHMNVAQLRFEYNLYTNIIQQTVAQINSSQIMFI